MTTTYCTRNDVQSVLGEPALLAAIDDNRDGVITGQEEQFVTDCINRAAVEMNESLCCQYSASSLLTMSNGGNDWCRWCNAYIASWMLCARRANIPAGSIVDQVETYRDRLREIRWGRFHVPEQRPSFDHLPSVSNFSPELANSQSPITVDTELSTTSAPNSTRKRVKAGGGGTYWRW